MRFEVKHALGTDAAVRRIDSTIEQLRASPLPAGIEVTDITKEWEGNVIRLSAKVGKSFLKAKVSATGTVLDDRVVIEMELPGMLAALVPAAKVEDGIKGKLGGLLEG